MLFVEKSSISQCLRIGVVLRV